MALDRLTALAALSLSFSLSLSFACAPSPNSDANAAKAGPQPTVVCQHVRTLAANDSKDEQALDAVQRDCVQTLEGLASRYETFATCVQDATTSAAVIECEDALAKPPSLLANASPALQIEVVCDHVISRLRAELPQMDSSVDSAEVQALRQRCIDEAGKKREEIGAQAFGEQAKCLLAATDLKTLQACGSF